ncbi:hypothetical protein A2962_00690 [Candidatus Woesebacteria bacterium RIFCSPLOWO2_01_FULL_39_61]|uniref:Cell envelope-related transcriptional attenuator domain-containing protein n=1 Tax=Candidatus Woesebacteria bacterium RIFCSPHIGHO2_02_FULL_39_13 TaxID=1802505 RepID=A0A1F7Z287_9BACT|nr:MAG: hypothetical protein A2692_04820 [Candidatus Woesebacteria bacterium RIFCSPHIGHO2_01_FULL_39_95]OGM33574.1 MAG: hypothetical protein A3D01_01305 [Candidatus Woesebacteria bacterium RIFCSPHIGHO2_02_FULL_39_13]OGM36696.1 MAG: hypothetical protein A3E13_00185 [Candidatus Woesebacteria bacterium RIFCSPHIGHO2_12_FULL_40_20]OGM68569.1 MAG: hypothetical protein A2962_00690 [Candidatus Woesebacteria bacterium RIFCSPLOWO2_01_FULL_39_61]OGM71670.1 MAG: hypothetical protein A3H19_01475 [Candidatus
MKSETQKVNTNNFITERGTITDGENLTESESLTEENLRFTFKRTRFQIAASRIKRRIFKHVKIMRLLSVFTFAALFLLFIVIFRSLLTTIGLGYYLGLFSDFVFTPEAKIESINGVTNILILGKGGDGHEAPDLTDTIIFASISHKTGRIVLISLPRDIWIPALRAKLNSTYYWGNQKKTGGGLILAKSQVEEILGKPIQYAAILDFSGFKQIIDIIGGIDVNVENSFTDNKYPITGRENDTCDGDREFKCRYETISFEKGTQHMDGELTLKFVRSRNSEGDEGTDLAREKRQQKVIDAIKDRVLDREILLSPKTLLALKNTLAASTETDLNVSNTAILARRLFDSRDEVYSYVLPQNFLVNPPISPTHDNLYVFIPKDKKWDKVQEWVECVIDQRDGCQ